jgi:RNA polymerase sigma-70 factor (ECF subfamily)
MAGKDSLALAPTADLVKAAQEKDRQALEALFERYLPRVRQIVALRVGRRLRQMDELEDIAQEALLGIFQALPGFEHRSEGTFRNWVARCVEREILHHVRDRGAKKRGGGKVRRFADCGSQDLLSSIAAKNVPRASELARANELRDRIEKTLLEMPEQHREVIILRCLCEMSYGEIGQTLGFAKEASVRKALSRALKELAQGALLGEL